MPSVFALRVLLGAGLGLGALDVVWINAALAPRLVQHETASTPAVAEPAVTDTVPSESTPSEHAAAETVPSEPTPSEPAPAAPAPSEPALAEPTPSEPALAEPTPTTPAPAADDVVTVHVYFATGSAVLDARARNVLARLVANAGPTAEVVLEGRADYRGDESRNETLSKDRAVSVEQQLVQLGIARSRIRVGYLGEGDATSELWRDRRVDIQIRGGTR